MKQLLVFLFLLCSTNLFAQDVIVKKDGSTIVCRVVELTSTEITYKKWSDLNGSNYVMNRADASVINYEDGKKVNLSETTNLYTPHNQNDGTQQYNDRALLGIDYIDHTLIRKANKLRTIGWISGGVLVGLGAYIAIAAPWRHDGRHKNPENVPVGCGIAALGVGSVLYFSYMANKIEKKAQMLQMTSLYQHNIPLSNGSSLSLGADLLRDNTLGQNTLGLGLRYNF